MQFNSIEFLFCFLPLFLAVYLIIPARLRNAVLILGSLSFYVLSGNGNYWWAGILAVSTALTYFAGLSLAKSGRGKLLALYLSLMGLLLAFFKLYAGGIYLPAGMSFYLFQMAAYLIDVYRLKFVPERDLLAFGAQLTFFPKLLSGPMMDPRRLQLHCRYCTPTYEDFHDGLQELIIGLSLKVLLANRLGGLWAQPSLIGYEHISTPAAWLGLMAFTMQLYFDFYGYSLMAMGLGRMLGYDLPRNFDDPYAAGSVSEFYRRWHVTLGAWFREYLYIPLGGSRKGIKRTILNLAVVWLFTGLWHGVGGNYLLWAGFLCLLIINERLWLGALLKKTHVICHVYTVFVILLSWIPFAIGDWNRMTVFVGRLFGFCGQAANPRDYAIWGNDYALLLAVGVVLATPFPRKLWEKIRRSTLADVMLFVLFWAAVYLIATAAQDPFLYFQY
ncbi:MAG: MBOAT family protein [Oscillospiraceae bacterium]|nr:MBOAT family protein [Oscillospiraceae bacterium]